MQVKFIIVVIFLLLGGCWLLIQNSQPVEIKFFLLEPIETPLVVVMVFSFLLGTVLSLFISLVDQAKLHRTIKQQEKEIKKLKEKVDLHEHMIERNKD